MKHWTQQIREPAGLRGDHALLPQSSCKSMGISRRWKETFLLMNCTVIIKFHRETANTIFTNMLLESAES